MKRYYIYFFIAIGLVAFLAGYLLVSGGLGGRLTASSGTILDKFSDSDKKPGSEQIEEGPEIFSITDRRVNSLANSTNKNSVLYYEKNTGKVFEYSLTDREEKVVSDRILPNFLSTIWSPNKKEVISSFYSPTSADLRYFNFTTMKDRRFDKSIKSIAFSPDANLIAYYSLESDSGSSSFGRIFIAQPDGEYEKSILNTRIAGIEVSWPAKDEIILKTPTKEIFTLTESGQITKFMDFKLNLEEKWSHSGKKMLFSYLDTLGFDDDPSPQYILGVKDIDSREEKLIRITAHASRCAWSLDDKNVYCVLPKTPSVDEIYLINTEDSSKKLIAEPEMPISELFLAADEDDLLFISASNDRLYGLHLP